MTKAQRWARQRNFAKFRLAGVKENLQMLTISDFMLSTERIEIRRAIILIDETLDCWKARNGLSKKKFMEGK